MFKNNLNVNCFQAEPIPPEQFPDEQEKVYSYYEQNECSRDKSPQLMDSKRQFSGQIVNPSDESERKNFEINPEDGALWTEGVVGEWVKDIENSMDHVAQAIRKLEAILEEVCLSYLYP